ncbi:diguanylate cyclase domain-containing protein [Mycobacterium sp. 4D054]|uniref:diguanylate cyclase domain-containing protein n=1 Tax=Mycobacterium sp. 4D054 TaxID=3457440 RepID=UPI003FD12908
MTSRDDFGEDCTAAEFEYHRLLDRSLVPVCIHDGKIVRYVNPVAVRALGATASVEIIDRPIADFIAPASLGAVTAALAHLRADGDVSGPGDYSLMRVDGSVLAAQAVAALRLQRGDPTYEVIFRDPMPARPMVLAGDSGDRKPTAATITTTLDGIVTDWSADAHDLYGRSADEVVGMPVERAVGAPLYPDALVRSGSGCVVTTHIDAEGAPLAVRVLVVRTSGGYVVVCDTVVAADRSGQRLHAVLDLLHEGVVIVGSDGRFQFANAAARRILGSGAEDLVGLHHSNHGADLPMYDHQGRLLDPDSHPLQWILKTGLSLRGEVVGVDRLDGTRIWVTGHGRVMHPEDPQNSPILMSFTDITEHYDARERLLHEATHDWLTGLPNRGHALDHAAAAMSQTGADRLSAVLFIDLDRLKSVNDNHGHTIGDDVLRRVAQRMRSATRPQDLVARIGGDEFVVLLMGPVEEADVDAIAECLHEVLAEEMLIGSLKLRVGASIGITTISDDDRRSLGDVLRDADAAMYRAKAQGRASTARFEAAPDRLCD